MGMAFLLDLSPHCLSPLSTLPIQSQWEIIPALKIYSSRMPSPKPKSLGELKPKRLIYCSNTVWPQYRLDNRSQWPENGTHDYNTLWDLDNFCHHKGKWSEIPYVQAFFALCTQPSLCESCFTSQILLAHSGPHPPNTMSPNPCSDFSFFDPADHSSPFSRELPLSLPIPLQLL